MGSDGIDDDIDDGPFAILDKSDGMLGTLPVTCECGHEFCFSCLGAPHAPAPCDIAQAWTARSSKDTTELWLLAQTKPCPKCNVRIEKARACNHMSCSKCRHQFCWLCMADWSRHSGGSFVCNRFNEARARGEILTDLEKVQIESQQEIQKFHYYETRVTQHRAGAEFAKKLRGTFDRTLARMSVSAAETIMQTYHSKMQSQEGSRDTSAPLRGQAALVAVTERLAFLPAVVEKIILARHVLQWSYVTGFYMKSTDSKRLFEMQQDLLVNTVEELQTNVDDGTRDMALLLADRKKILDAVAAMEGLRSFLVRHISGGGADGMLLYESDKGVTARTWVCKCGKEMSTDALQCSKCTACQKHGEEECKACFPR